MKHELNIPRSFRLINRKIDVAIDQCIEYRDGDIGNVTHNINKMLLSSSVFDKRCRCQVESNAIFWHEYYHIINDLMGLDEHDEKVSDRNADLFGRLMAQFMDTVDWTPPSIKGKVKGKVKGKKTK